MTRVLITLTSVGIAAFSVVSANEAESQALPWRVTESVNIDVNWDGRGAVQIAPDGSLYVLNYTTSEVVHVGPTGAVLWRAGREGRGPGEFVQAYRLAPRPSGGVIVYDKPTGSLTFFDEKGQYGGKKDLSVRFNQVDGIVETTQGDIVIAGYAGSGSGASARTMGSAIHVFGPDMTLLRSFGPLPFSKDSARTVLKFWGAGYITLAADGSLWYARKLPYELYRFAVDGTLLQKIDMHSVEKTADDFFKREAVVWNGRPATRHSVSGDDVPRPAAVVEITPSMLLTGLIQRTGNRMDIVSRNGVRGASAPMPDGWLGIVGFDPKRSHLWAAATVNDEPVLVRQRLILTP